MTDFKITPEDVGRVAVDYSDNEIEIVFVDESNAVGRWQDGTGALVIYGTDGYQYDSPDLTHWKPRTLEAPKRWWCVWRHIHRDEIHWDHFPSYPHESERERTNATLIAVVYDHFWHGCEEGRFDTPESIGDLS